MSAVIARCSRDNPGEEEGFERVGLQGLSENKCRKKKKKGRCLYFSSFWLGCYRLGYFNVCR